MKKHWLSEELALQIRKVFEPRYNREITDDEVIEIAESLANFAQSTISQIKKYGNKQCIQN